RRADRKTNEGLTSASMRLNYRSPSRVWTQDTQMPKKILTVSELAEHLSVHRITIYRLLKGGTLPGFKIGRVWRFDLDDIAKWMATGKEGQELVAADGHVSADDHAEHNGVPKA